ncbi:MAG: hypothetical protein B9S32_03710 [Verrucomicrobia bacterium Tous-C9LFEB]|nr:MAG: hypothetical protein B9S32_03710 [Verrucomicrobia bacterium Tous-C9LFEB]
MTKPSYPHYQIAAWVMLGYSVMDALIGGGMPALLKAGFIGLQIFILLGFRSLLPVGCAARKVIPWFVTWRAYHLVITLLGSSLLPEPIDSLFALAGLGVIKPLMYVFILDERQSPVFPQLRMVALWGLMSLLWVPSHTLDAQTEHMVTAFADFGQGILSAIYFYFVAQLFIAAQKLPPPVPATITP